MNNVHDAKDSRAVIYVRVSTTAQADEGNSLASQERICREFAERKGYKVVQVFVDAGESAKTANRTEFQNMLKFCAIKKNDISAVIVYKVDRFARSTEDHTAVRSLLKRYKVDLLSATEQFDDSAAGKFIENTLANVAQFDNDMRSERCGGGMKDAVREGRYVWPAPIGYLNSKVSGKSNLEKSEMAPKVLESFEFVATGMYPVDDVWSKMTARGLHLGGGKPLARSYFYKMLENPVYMGIITQFGERNVGTFEPIVSEELFNHVRAVLRRRSKAHPSYKLDNPDFPLRRFILTTAGHKLTGSWAKKKTIPYYRFRGLAKNNLPRDNFHKEFSAFMDSYALSPAYLAKLESLVKKKFTEATKGQHKSLEAVESRLKELETHQTVLIEKNINGVVSDTVLKKQLERMDEEILTLHDKQVSLTESKVDVAGALSLAREYLSAPGKVWLQVELKTKTKLQRFQFPSGVLFHEKKFKTNEVSLLFATESVFSTELSTGVDPSGFEPLTSSLQMKRSTN